MCLFSAVAQKSQDFSRCCEKQSFLKKKVVARTDFSFDRIMSPFGRVMSPFGPVMSPL